jgi:hypothetical protein
MALLPAQAFEGGNWGRHGAGWPSHLSGPRFLKSLCRYAGIYHNDAANPAA